MSSDSSPNVADTTTTPAINASPVTVHTSTNALVANNKNNVKKTNSNKNRKIIQSPDSSPTLAQKKKSNNKKNPTPQPPQPQTSQDLQFDGQHKEVNPTNSKSKFKSGKGRERTPSSDSSPKSKSKSKSSSKSDSAEARPSSESRLTTKRCLKVSSEEKLKRSQNSSSPNIISKSNSQTKQISPTTDNNDSKSDLSSSKTTVDNSKENKDLSDLKDSSLQHITKTEKSTKTDSKSLTATQLAHKIIPLDASDSKHLDLPTKHSESNSILTNSQTNSKEPLNSKRINKNENLTKSLSNEETANKKGLKCPLQPPPPPPSAGTLANNNNNNNSNIVKSLHPIKFGSTKSINSNNSVNSLGSNSGFHNSVLSDKSTKFTSKVALTTAIESKSNKCLPTIITSITTTTNCNNSSSVSELRSNTSSSRMLQGSKHDRNHVDRRIVGKIKSIEEFYRNKRCKTKKPPSNNSHNHDVSPSRHSSSRNRILLTYAIPDLEKYYEGGKRK